MPEENRNDYRCHVEGEPFSLHGPRTLGPPFDAPNGPVVGVSWHEAVAYCNWLNQEFAAQKPWVRHSLSTAKGQGKRLLEEDRLRVVRGGAWNDYPDNCRAAYRFRIRPVLRNLNLGISVGGVPHLWALVPLNTVPLDRR